MAGLTDTTIAASYDQLLIVDRDGGGNGTTHVAVKDGDGDTTFPVTLASDAIMITSTNRLEFGDDASYIHQSADGVLDLVSDTEIEINATNIDINGAVDMASTLAVGDTLSVSKSQNSETALTVTNSDTTSSGAGHAEVIVKNSNGNVGGIRAHTSGFNTSNFSEADGFTVESYRQILHLVASNDKDIKFWNGTSNNVTFANGGTATFAGQLRVGGAGSGSSENLLVTSATSSDHTRVHIEKTANAGSAGVSLNSYTPSASWTIYQDDNSDGDLIFYDDSDSVLTLATDNSATFAGKVDLGTQTNAVNSFTVNRSRFGGHATSITDVIYNAYWSGSAWINDDDSSDSLFYRLQHDVGHIWYYSAAQATPSFTEQMRLTTAGTLGIGTSSPEAKLDVVSGNVGLKIGGDVNAETLTNDTRKYARFTMHHYHNAEEAITLITGDSDGTDNIVAVGGMGSQNASTQVRFYTAANDATTTGTERMRITSAGNVVINHTAAAVDLTATATLSTVNFANQRNDLVIDTYHDGGEMSTLWFRKSDNNTKGTKTATASGRTLGAIYWQGVDTGGNFDYGAGIEVAQNSSASARCSADMKFYTSDGTNIPERMRITSGGQLLLGSTNTNPWEDTSGDGSFIYHQGTGSRNTGIAMSTDANVGYSMFYLNMIDGANDERYFAFYRNDTQIGTITLNGTSNVSYDTSSDYRLKENIEPMTGSIARLKQIKPSTFNFISEPDRSCEGFIAHELGEVVPNAVSGKKDAMRDDGEKIMPQGVDFGRVVPLLVSALQEAIERIEILESK